MNEPDYRAQAPSTPRRTPVKQQIKRGLWALALVLVLIFVLQNIQTVSLNYWFWGFQWPLALLIIITLAVGMMLGWAVTRLFQTRRRP